MSDKTYKIIKNTVLIVLAIVTTIAIIIGCSWHFGGLFGFHIYNPFNTIKMGEIVNDTKVFDEKIEAVYLGTDIGNVNVAYGNILSVEVNLPEKIMPEIYVKDNALYIQEKHEFSLANNASLVDDYYINITIPEETKLENVDLILALGELTVTDIVCDEFSAELDCGNLGIDSITCTSLSASLDLGDLNISNTKTGVLDINNKCGDIKVENVKSESVESNSNLGDMRFTNVSFDKGYFAGDCGDIKISGDFPYIKAELALGDVDIHTDRPESEVKIEADTDLGQVSINK